jgi:2-keto-4-pentenoate hydratase
MSATRLWDDPRVVRGMQRQLDLRRALLAAGDKPLGWKVGFGAPAMLKQFDIAGPLIGFLTQRGRVQSGDSVSLKGWAKPVAEPEIAVHIGRDVPAGADGATAAAAIGGISPAIELVDVHTPPQDVECILSENIYQRHVVLGGSGPARAGHSPELGSSARDGANSDGLICRIMRHGQEFARTTDPQANTGQWVEIVRHVADVLAAFGETLRAGEIIITGSVVPPLALEPHEEGIAFEVDPIGGVDVRFEY